MRPTEEMLDDWEDALRFYYEDDCQSVGMGILESVFDRPAAFALGIDADEAAKDVASYFKRGEVDAN